MGLSRRDLLTFLRPPARPSAPDRRPWLRPPGALPEPAFLAACTRCDACRTACPRSSIRIAGAELGLEREGTPLIDPALAPCWLCKDLPCITVCEPAALRPLVSPRDARMGELEIAPERCFSAQGNPCEVCVERCPVRPKPIAVHLGEPPDLDRDACTGCGVCAWLCPAQALRVSGSAS